MNFAKFLRAPFFKEHLWWLLLNVVNAWPKMNVVGFIGCPVCYLNTQFYQIQASYMVIIGFMLCSRESYRSNTLVLAPNITDLTLFEIFKFKFSYSYVAHPRKVITELVSYRENGQLLSCLTISV